jgi:predicted amidohydrolase
MRLALAQMDVDAAATERNRQRALDTVETAAERDADLLALPELWNVGYFSFDTYEHAAEPLDGETLSELSAAAAEEDLALLAGTIVEDLDASAEAGFDVPAEDGLANTAVLFDSDGERQAVYRKHHLFGYESAETRLLEPGESLPVADLLGFEIAVTTCYDLRFPEQFRALQERGANLVLVPSAWPYPRVEHWRTLPRSRAVENLSFVATINGVGTFDEAELLGRSTIYDPWGTTVAAASTDATVVTADIDPERVEDVRAEFPALGDRREY